MNCIELQIYKDILCLYACMPVAIFLIDLHNHVHLGATSYELVSLSEPEPLRKDSPTKAALQQWALAPTE